MTSTGKQKRIKPTAPASTGSKDRADIKRKIEECTYALGDVFQATQDMTQAVLIAVDTMREIRRLCDSADIWCPGERTSRGVEEYLEQVVLRARKRSRSKRTEQS